MMRLFSSWRCSQFQAAFDYVVEVLVVEWSSRSAWMEMGFEHGQPSSFSKQREAVVLCWISRMNLYYFSVLYTV